jgi:hypothetical protein
VAGVALAPGPTSNLESNLISNIYYKRRKTCKANCQAQSRRVVSKRSQGHAGAAPQKNRGLWQWRSRPVFLMQMHPGAPVFCNSVNCTFTAHMGLVVGAARRTWGSPGAPGGDLLNRRRCSPPSANSCCIHIPSPRPPPRAVSAALKAAVWLGSSQQGLSRLGSSQGLSRSEALKGCLARQLSVRGCLCSSAALKALWVALARGCLGSSQGRAVWAALKGCLARKLSRVAVSVPAALKGCLGSSQAGRLSR